MFWPSLITFGLGLVVGIVVANRVANDWFETLQKQYADSLYGERDRSRRLEIELASACRQIREMSEHPIEAR